MVFILFSLYDGGTLLGLIYSGQHWVSWDVGHLALMGFPLRVPIWLHQSVTGCPYEEAAGTLCESCTHGLDRDVTKPSWKGVRTHPCGSCGPGLTHMKSNQGLWASTEACGIMSREWSGPVFIPFLQQGHPKQTGGLGCLVASELRHHTLSF